MVAAAITYRDDMSGNWRSRVVVIGAQVTVGLLLAGFLVWPPIGALALPFFGVILIVGLWPKRRRRIR